MYRVVVVDDEKTIAEGIAALFPWNSIGFEAVAFTDPRVALAYIEREGTDVVLSDIEMPGMSGIELCQALQGKGITVVLLSSHQNYDYFRSAIRCSVEDYLLKPVHSEDIAECFGKIRERLDAERNVKDEEPPSTTYYETIRKGVEDYLEENYREARLEEAALRVNLSAAYLSSLLKDKVGCGFTEMLTRIRMEKAAALLADVQYKAYDIAYYVGYDNPKSFSRAFKNYYGCSPTEYRQSGRLLRGKNGSPGPGAEEARGA